MSTISKNTLAYLKDLKKNNYREWFQDNKPRYEEARAEFLDFIDSLIGNIAEFDPAIAHHTAKGCVFRIYRDVRFSKDKSPYKTHFGAHISAAAKRSDIHSRAGYYIHIAPGESMLAGGAYMPQGSWIKGIREAIANEPASFKKIINNKAFVDRFGELEGERLKTAPKGYPKDHPEIDLLRLKSFMAISRYADKEVLNKGFLDECTQTFNTLKPLDDFLNQAGS